MPWPAARCVTGIMLPGNGAPVSGSIATTVAELVQGLREVAAALRRGRHQAGLRAGVAIARALVADEEVSVIGAEQVRDGQRSAERMPKRTWLYGDRGVSWPVREKLRALSAELSRIELTSPRYPEPGPLRKLPMARRSTPLLTLPFTSRASFAPRSGLIDSARRGFRTARRRPAGSVQIGALKSGTRLAPPP